MMATATPRRPRKSASKSQIGGMLLEEAALFLLEGSGYTTVSLAATDPTLVERHGMLCVRGRGSDHQIDAIADFSYAPPFGNPHRLLVEAKMLKSRVSLPVIRNALGVHRDVCEFWVPPRGQQGQPQRPRHHYQYAVFSASGFSKEAQAFAFAQDIFLLDMQGAGFLKEIVDAAGAFAEVLAEQLLRQPSTLQDLRAVIRGELRPVLRMNVEAQPSWARTLGSADRFFTACKQVGRGLLGMLQSQLPVLLVPAPDLRIDALPSQVEVQVFWSDTAWILRDSVGGRDLFSFRLPEQLWTEFERRGLLKPEHALDFKQQHLSRIIACHKQDDGSMRFISFRLDEGWIDAVKRRLGNPASPPRASQA